MRSTYIQQNPVWAQPADKTAVTETMKALRDRGISTEFVPDRTGALAALTRLIPDGAGVMTASSGTLEEIGFTILLRSGSHRWKDLRAEIQAENDASKRAELRKKATFSQFFLGSVHAVARTGEVLTASGGGSQLGAYAYTADKVVWVAGSQKIVPTLEDGFRRIREYSLPLEDARMKRLGFPGSSIGKILVVEKERPGRIHMVFVGENIGF